MNDASLVPITKALAEHFQSIGEPVPAPEELADQAKNLLSFFEILMKARRENQLDIGEGLL